MAGSTHLKFGVIPEKLLQLVSDQADMLSASMPSGTFQLESGREDLH